MKKSEKIEIGLTKEEFRDAIKTIDICDKKLDVFIAAVEALGNDSGRCDCFIYGEYETLTVNLLEKLMHDVGSDISHYIYDMHLGYDLMAPYTKGGKVGRPPSDNEGNYLYTDVDSLYDYLVKQEEEGNHV